MSIDKELANINPSRETLLTIGVFDGVHLGHQQLLNHLCQEANKKGWLGGVVTFKSHPKSVLTSGKPLIWLTDLEERIRLIKGLGIEIVVALSFTQAVKQLGAYDFMRKMKDYLKIKGLVVGPDFALGRDREGNIDLLKKLGKEMDYFVEVMPPFTIDNEVVRSSSIRQALTEGNIAKVNKFLGRPFSISGVAVAGDQRGRTLGFPTVNLNLNSDMASPKDGVYATITRINEKKLSSVTNIGVRPTFGGGHRLIETHIIGFSGHLVREKIEVSFIERIRDEKKFNNAEELKMQIARDIESATVYLNKYSYVG